MSKVKANLFEKLCRTSFKFLEEKFDCSVITTTQDVYADYVTYKNATTGVKIGLEPMESGVSILLLRLINGRLPDYEVSIKSDTVLNSFYLDDLIALRGPTLKIKQPLLDLFPPGGPNERLLRRILDRYAELLEQYAADVLRGDFCVFDKLSEIVKKRAREHRNTTKIWRFPKLHRPGSG